jgi:transcriptional repressor NrdR
MKCPFCRETTTEVYNSRRTRFATQIWRRRRCKHCGESFTTYEAPDLGFLSVLKRSGRPEAYSRPKLYSSLYKAFDAATGQADAIDAVTDTVEAKILDRRNRHIASDDIARIVLITLKHFSATAFLRYLSYQTELARDTQFKKELKKYGQI